MLDLRLCLQSADRELAELKEEAGEERKGLQARLMEHMQRVSSSTARLCTAMHEAFTTFCIPQSLVQCLK